MEELQQFVNKMRATSSSLEKIAIIKEQSEWIHGVLEYTYNPYKQYHVTSKTCKKHSDKVALGHHTLFQTLDYLTTREVTGHDAIKLVNRFATKNIGWDLIYKIIYALFGDDVELRFRPSYFPFTEPSAEVDILSKEGKWLEILGCGVVNPIVLENCNIDSNKYSGLAFGLGIERIAMLKHGVTDIREFYKSNLDFLSQFK